MSRSRQQAEKPQSLLEFELCVCKIDVLGAIKSTEFVLVIKTCFGQICACNNSSSKLRDNLKMELSP